MQTLREQFDLGAMETQYMKVADLISALQTFRGDLDVCIGDRLMELDDIDCAEDGGGLYIQLGDPHAEA